MNHKHSVTHFELIYVIVNYGMGSRILQKAKKYGIPGGTVFLGRGTVDNSLLKFLSLSDQRKEIVLFGTSRQNTTCILEKLNQDFQFEKPNHGIIFTTSVGKIVGSRTFIKEENQDEREVRKSMYQLIVTIVNRGDATDVIDAAEAAGSKGGTVINARGSGIHETSKLFNMEIEPEKEMVLILSKEGVTDLIVSAIQAKLEIDKPGKGIIFVQDVNQTYGIYE